MDENGLGQVNDQAPVKVNCINVKDNGTTCHISIMLHCHNVKRLKMKRKKKHELRERKYTFISTNKQLLLMSSFIVDRKEIAQAAYRKLTT